VYAREIPGANIESPRRIGLQQVESRIPVRPRDPVQRLGSVSRAAAWPGNQSNLLAGTRI
jgi:hypothetical protein